MVLRLDKALFIGSLCYLVLAVAWLKLPRQDARVQVRTGVDSEFIAYLEESLALIPEQGTIAEQPRELPRTSPLVEKVYVPIYQPPQIIVQEPAPDPTIPPPPPSSSEVAEASPPVAVQEIERSLVGIFAASADMLALFAVNDETVEVRVGEGIADTGWSVQQITDLEVWIEQSGTVKKLRVGQQF